MKKIMNSLLMAALVCGLSLGVTSCKDSDDDNNKSEEEQAKLAEEEQEQENNRFAILSQLTDLDEVGDSTYTIENYLALTDYQPTIGTADENEPTTRIVSTNTMEAAADRFADLVEVEIDSTTASYTWEDEKMGSMTYRKINDGTAWAEVEVRVKQVRGLEKIIYRSPAQGDNNSKFEGRAYYRFGDVVCDNIDESKGRYWVCVRPAFGPEGKEKSHWVCIDKLGSGNIKKHSTDDGNMMWWMPTGLGEDKEHMQNLAEMLYAMLYPATWENNIKDKNIKKLRMFNDFDRLNVRYHNRYFWARVCKQWDKNQLWEKVFHTSKENLKAQLNSGGLKLLHTGYSWQWWLTETLGGWNCSLYEATFTNGTGKECNMHQATYKTVKKKMKTSNNNYIKLDCRDMTKVNNYKAFFGDTNLRWCIRHDTYSKVKISLGPSYKDVYTYYRNLYNSDLDRLYNDPDETMANEVDLDVIKR